MCVITFVSYSIYHIYKKITIIKMHFYDLNSPQMQIVTNLLHFDFCVDILFEEQYSIGVISQVAHLKKWGNKCLIIIDKKSRVPVYEQIKNQIITFIRVGVYVAHAKLPSIRSISADTATNVNTVKKAFSELELSGVIYTVPGIGSFVSENALESSNISAKAMRQLADDIEVAKSIGVTAEQITELVNSIYKEENND